MLNLFIKFAFVCALFINCSLTIVAPKGGGIKTKIYHHDSEFLPSNDNANYQTTTYNNQYIRRNNDDLLITYNQGSIPTTNNKLYVNFKRDNQNNENLQGQQYTHNSLIDNSNAVYVENNIISHKSECPPGATGQFPYMYDCRRFLNCWKGRGYVQACSPGTVFNPRLLECDSPQKVNCIGGGSPNARIVEYPTSQSIPRTQIISDNAITCSPGTSGLKPHPFECSKFLNCDNGRTFIQNCGPGTVFNPLISVCDYPDNVDCGKTTVTTNVAVLDDSSPSGSNINYNSHHENPQPNYNQFDSYRNPKEYNGHGFNAGYSQNTGYSGGSSSGYSHNANHGTTSTTGYTQTNGHSNGYPQMSGYPHQSTHPHHPGYPQPHRHHSTQQTIPVWPTSDSKNPSTNNYYPNNNNMGLGATQTNHQQQHSSARTTTSRPTSWIEENRNHQAPNYQTNQSPKSVYDKPYDINQASVHEILQNNNLDNNNATTKIYYATAVDYNSEEIFGNDDTTINISQVFNRDENQKHIPFNLPRESTKITTTTTTTVPPVVKFQPYPNYDRRDQVKNSTTPKTTIYYATPVEYNSEENFRNIAGGDIPSYDPFHYNDNYDKTNVAKPLHNFDSLFDTITTTTNHLLPHHFPTTTPSYIPSANQVKNISKNTVHYVTPVQNFGNTVEGAGNSDDKTYVPKPLFNFESLFETITTPANHLLPPNFQTTTPSYTPFAKNYPIQNKTNVHIYPIYSINQNNHNSTLKQNTPSVSPAYSGVTHSKNPIKSYDQPYLSSANLQIPSISNQIIQTNPPIIFNRDDGVIRNEPLTDESVIVPIYVRPTRPPTIIYSTQSQTRSVPPPSLYNQLTSTTPTNTVTTPKSYTVTTSISSTTENNLDVDKDTEDLPISDALKILLRPYVNKNENINEQDITKMLESHIMKIENNQAKENLKKQVEIIVTGEQEHMANRSFNEGTTTSNPIHQHHHINHHHQHRQHSKEFHRNHPNLPNPFENDYTASTYNRNPTTVKPKTTIHPDAETISIDRRFGFNPPVNRNIPPNKTPDPIDDGQQIIPVGNFGGTPTAMGADNYCQFDCGNGKCIKHFEVCDGVNNCGNRKDEQKCDRLGYEVRLVNDSNNKHMGRIEVKINGKWGYVCDDKFDLNDANVVCRELGFPLGASEIRGNSYYLPATDLMSSYNNVSFVMDELDCVGNETSLRNCDFKGWGVHDCNADEVVGVVCKIPIMKCPHDYWLCATSMECIPPNFVCDNTVDCSDGSDESNDVCKSKIEYRLINGNTRLEGRIEVKYRNEWGTICDDDFGKSEAAVVCRNLGYHGPAEVIKNTYGAGYGPIWLDQVSCFGNETCLDQCTHWKWGENNCNHSEDVSIRCSIGSIRPSTIVDNSGIKGKTLKHTEIEDDDTDDLDYLFYNTRSSKVLDISKPKCGYYNPDILDEEFEERQKQRIIHGNVARLGRHPWQATIRVKGVHGMSSHLCGAVLISRRHLLTAAHCISDYEKGAFFIRLGDHRTDRKEEYEKDVFIHDWYIHENYRKVNHMNNDIALIVIKEPVQFNDYIQPICLPEENAKYDSEKMCTISGWGSDRTGQSAPSKVLRAAEVPILSNNICKQPEVYGRHITDGMFCAGFLDGKFDACDGDSGGPMACTDGSSQVLYGITSWGLRCGHENKPGVYVKISQYIEWIKRKINHSIQSRNK